MCIEPMRLERLLAKAEGMYTTQTLDEGKLEMVFSLTSTNTDTLSLTSDSALLDVRSLGGQRRDREFFPYR